jgi:hypothetical protein
MDKFPDPLYRKPNQDTDVPDTSTKASRTVSAVMRRDIGIDEVAAELIPTMPRKDFISLFASLMTMHDKQCVFKYISIGPSAPDLVCEISFHNDIPKLVNGRYVGHGTARDGMYTFSGMVPKFPGMIASARGVIIGDPNDPRNKALVFHTQKARKTRNRVP